MYYCMLEIWYKVVVSVLEYNVFVCAMQLVSVRIFVLYLHFGAL